MNPRFPHHGPIEVEGREYDPAEVIAALGPCLTPRRRARIDQVVAMRTCNIAPVLEGLYDHGNRNAVLRSAEGLGYQVAHVIDSSERYLEARRVSQGAEKWMDVRVWETTAEAAAALKGQGFRILVTHFEQARDISAYDFDAPTALVFGNEHAGVSGEMLDLADGRVVLPMRGFVQSFNISVAAALCLYHIQQWRMRALGGHGDLSSEERTALTARFYARATPRAAEILARVAGAARE